MALDYYGRKFTYADLIVNVKKTAAALRGVGVKKGDIVTVVSVMTPEVKMCIRDRASGLAAAGACAAGLLTGCGGSSSGSASGAASSGSGSSYTILYDSQPATLKDVYKRQTSTNSMPAAGSISPTPPSPTARTAGTITKSWPGSSSPGCWNTTSPM